MSIKIIKDQSDAKLDIVFVHGLRASQEHWTTENSVFWPEKILPGHISNARLLAFEYEDATVDSFWNEEDLISDISDDLLSELMAERRGDKAERPIIFIAHCLGGLVCENALIRGANHEKRKQLVNSVVGVVLLGTPHFQPGTINEAAKFFQLSNEEIPSSSDLQAKSKSVLKIPQEFAKFRQGAQVKLETFYEGSLTKVNDGEVKIVDLAVAKFTDDSPPTRLAGNHHQMSRFDSEKDKDFKKVCRVLEDWVEDLPEPEEKGTVNNISNASFAGSNNYGYQLGQNTGNQTGFTFGAR
ncbi:hypothetical protein PMG11_09762 [Penicillium brasilianum]|uniref:Uncharacterized protein n=1 Tax=Penicillium brasilianum TaxID=104259 RepID=A0A0F7U0P3_PENBI|nr:hypothetical protein PMG11_09762 [Penicillium brasilianum]